MIDEEFRNIDFAKSELASSYVGCSFESCSFARADVSDILFEDCTFIDCDFSTTKVVGTSFQEVTFDRCKVQGVLFETAKPFLFSFRGLNSNFDHSSFYKVDMQNCTFDGSSLKQADFSESNCTGVPFKACLLHDTRFDRSALQRADFTTAAGFTIDPNINDLKGAKFSKDNLSGLLSIYPIKII